MDRKPSMGRQKIEMTKIKKKNHLQVTFSKRRSGLFKKASELCTLCGVEIALVVFSPAGKAFSFGHPNVESIINKFFTRNSIPPSSTDNQPVSFEDRRDSNEGKDLNMQITQLLSQLEVERKKGELINQTRMTRQLQFWWEAPVEEIGLHELGPLRLSLEELKKEVEIVAQKVLSSQILSDENFDHFERKPNDVVNAAVPSAYNLGCGNGFF